MNYNEWLTENMFLKKTRENRGDEWTKVMSFCQKLILEPEMSEQKWVFAAVENKEKVII